VTRPRQNPYQAPRCELPPPELEVVVAGGRPRFVRVLGILSIIFGAVTTLFSVWGLLQGETMTTLVRAWFRNAPASVRWREELLPVTARMESIQAVETCGYLAMSVLLVVVGVGQVVGQRWARRMTIVWAALAVIFLAAATATAVFHQQPALRHIVAYARTHLPSGLSVDQQVAALVLQGAFHWAMSLVFYLPYPVLLWIMFSTKRAKRALP